MTRPHLPAWDTLKTWGRKGAKVIVVIAVAGGLYGGYLGITWAHTAKDDSASSKTSSAAAAASAKAAARFAKENLISQNNHHAATVKADAAILAAEAVISYEGGVITFLLAEIAQGQQQGHQTLAEVQALQMEVTVELPAAVAALEKGQAEINAYLGYLTCLNLSTNASTCGAAPPLPSA